ncbi:hypothetical protein [Xanthomonas phage RTH11]|nr:hypothetical protein [Xanthomonas phage RTH11]
MQQTRISDTGYSSPPLATQGECFLVRRSAGCGCCPEEVRFFGPWLNKDEAEEYAVEQRKDERYSNREFSVGSVSYEIANNWLILKERYALQDTFIDLPGRESWNKELEDFEKLFSYF